MIPKYHENSQEVSIHSAAHKVCTHKVEDGWECSCSECQCETVINIHAAYAYEAIHGSDHGVIIKVNPGQYHGSSHIALSPDRARALASLLMFAANDAEQLNKDFPS